ncbi:MAG: ACP S-malonyltransferase, partial [Candidatus Nanopelagicales bacterium]
MLVVVAPGQGAQTPGFLTPWLDVPGIAERLEWLSLVSGVDLLTHGTKSDTDTIRDTAVAQPLIVGAGLVTLLSLFPHPSAAFASIGAGAGHSVGEITAAVGAGVLTAEQAIVFVRERGKAMAQASAVTQTGMAAVLGGDKEEVIAAATEVGLTCANINGAGQIVVAGTKAQLESFTPPEGARVRALEVAGAFHTEHMASASATLGRIGNALSTHDPRIRLISNSDGQVVHDGRAVVRRLVSQVAQPVRWDLCMQTMLDLGVTAMIEIPPAGTLTNLAKRAMPGVETLALKTPDDLPAAWKLIEKHGVKSTIETSPTWRLVISPAKGIFQTVDIAFAEGDSLPPHTHVGYIKTSREEIPIHAPHGGTIIEWLAQD